MTNRVVQIITPLALALVLLGCNGPSPYGEKMRVEAATRMDIVNARMMHDQARRSFEVGQFDKAQKQISLALRRDPENAEALVLQGRIFLETHRLDKALDSFVDAVEYDENSHDAHYFMGIVFQRWTDDEHAFEHYNKAYELDSENVQYLMATAESLIALGRLEEAEQMVQTKQDHFEHNAALCHLLGELALLQDHPAQAVRLYGEARLLNPEDQSLLEELAWAQFAASMYAACEASLNDLLVEYDNFERIDLLHLKARCLSLLERTTEARDLYIKLSRQIPSDPEVWIELGCLAWEVGDYRRVAQSSMRLIALAPRRYEGYMLKGINERHLGNLEQAAVLFRQSSRLSKTAAAPHLLLGRTMEEMGDLVEAVVAYEMATMTEPHSAEARALLARAQSRQATAVASGDPDAVHESP